MSFFILFSSLLLQAGCGGLKDETLIQCHRDEAKMMAKYNDGSRKSLEADRSRLVKFQYLKNEIKVSVGELLDLSPKDHAAWIYAYSQTSSKDELYGEKNHFDISSICRKLPQINGELSDGSMQFNCKDGVVNGQIRLNPISDKDFLSLTEVKDGKLLSSISSRKKIVVLKTQYFSPNWFVTKEFNKNGQVLSRKEEKDSKRNGINFDKIEGPYLEYKDGKFIHRLKHYQEPAVSQNQISNPEQ